MCFNNFLGCSEAALAADLITVRRILPEAALAADLIMTFPGRRDGGQVQKQTFSSDVHYFLAASSAKNWDLASWEGLEALGS